MENKEIQNVEKLYSNYITNKANIWDSKLGYGSYQSSTDINQFLASNKNMISELSLKINSCGSLLSNINQMSDLYVDFVNNQLLNPIEPSLLKNHFKGTLGEYTFETIFIPTITTFNVDGHIYRINNVAPLYTEDDMGIDFTATCNGINAVGQVKFWSMTDLETFAYSDICKTYTQASIQRFINEREYKNLIVVWFGNMDKVSIPLKSFLELMNHIIFIDENVLNKYIEDDIWEKVRKVFTEGIK